MEMRLIVGYGLLAILIGSFAGMGILAVLRARAEFRRRWGKQKRWLTPKWLR